MKAINHATLLSLFAQVKGATFATLITETVPKLKKTGNNLGHVRKVSRVNVCLGFQYDNAVNRQLGREGQEGDFVAAPRQWGVKVTPMIVEHKEKFYLETKVEKSLDSQYIDENGEEIPFELVEPFLPARRKSSRQGTEKEILVRDYSLDSLKSIAFNGETYLLNTALAPVAVTIVRRQPVTK
jgi:hypothetical protein